MTTHKLPEEKIEPQLIHLEEVIRSFIGDYALYESNLLKLGSLDVWALEKLPELLEGYVSSCQSSESKIASPFDATRELKDAGLEVMGKLSLQIAYENNKDVHCCPFHTRCNSYEQAISGNSHLTIPGWLWSYDGSFVEPCFKVGVNGRDYVFDGNLVTQISSPLISLPGFYEEYFIHKETKEANLEKKIGACNKIIGSFNQMKDFFELLNAISKKYPAVTSALHCLPDFKKKHSYDHDPTKIENLRGVTIKTKLYSPAETKSQISDYGRAISEVITYFKSIQNGPLRKSASEHSLNYLAEVENASNALERIKEAKSLFVEYHKTFQRYQSAGHGSFADF